MPFEEVKNNRRPPSTGLIVGGIVALILAVWVLLRILSAFVYIAKVLLVFAAVIAVAVAVTRMLTKRGR